LTTTAGLDGLESVHALYLHHNRALSRLDGLGALTTAGRSLDIFNNRALTSVDGLAALSTVGIGVHIYGNPFLPQCGVCAVVDQVVPTPPDLRLEGNAPDACPSSCL
jgi:hypothetical protein